MVMARTLGLDRQKDLDQGGYIYRSIRPCEFLQYKLCQAEPIVITQFEPKEGA